jgi:hypothetical protein
MGLLRPADWRAQWIADPTVMSTFPTRAPLRSDARGPRNGYHSAMAGSADTLKWVALDLGQVRSFDAVRLFPARPYDVQPDTPGYLFPVRFRIEAAALADFSDARVLLDRTAGDEPNPGTDTPLYRFASTEARFVRLAVTRLGRRAEGQFAFTMAEMVVQNENRSLAYGTQPRFLLQLEVECADGRVQTIVTDGSWHCTTDGPIRASGIYNGEAYDARQDMPGWDAPGFNAQSWRPVLSVAT